MNDPSKPDGIWTIDPKKGFLVTQAVFYSKSGNVWVTRKTEPMEIESGIWVPALYQEHRYGKPDDLHPREEPSNTAMIQLYDISINCDIPDDVFTIDSILPKSPRLIRTRLSNSPQEANEDANSSEQEEVDIAPADFKLRYDDKRKTYNLHVLIENQSDIPLPNHRIRYYRGDPKDDLDETGNPHSGWHEAGPINPGDRWGERTRDFFLPDGDYTFTVVLDYNNAIPETNETNNTATLNVKIQNGQIQNQSSVSSPQSSEEKGEIEIPLTAIQTISFKKDMPLVDTLRMLSKMYKVNIIVSNEIIRHRPLSPVSNLYDVTFEEALKAICGTTHTYEIKDNFVYVYTNEEYAAVPKEFTLKMAKKSNPGVFC